jgi:hypothetical protein
VKLQPDTVPITPVVPPGAGLDREGDFPPAEPNPGLNACAAVVDTADVATGALEPDTATPSDDPAKATTKADEAIQRFRLLRSHRGNFERLVDDSGIDPSVTLDSYSLITALLSNMRITRVPVFISETLEVAWVTPKKLIDISERRERSVEGLADSLGQ